MEEESLELDLAGEIGSSDSFSIQQLTLYIPQKDKHDNELSDQRRWVEEAAKILADIGGGCTILPPVEGVWKSPEGKLIWEKPILMYSYVDPDKLVSQLARLRSFLHKLGRETEQGQVAFEFDGEFHLISEYDPEEDK